MSKPLPYPLREEWLITDEGADLIMRVWTTAHETGKAERIALALEARDGQPFKNERNCVVKDGVAVVSIDGPLMRKAELFSDISGATSYQWISATCDRLRADSSVEKAIFRFSSPGGEAAGVGECAEKLAMLAAAKPTEAYVETQCASAAMWLASQCRKITAHPTAQVGWIGAVRTMTDDSKRDEMQGVREHQLVSEGAENKRTQPVTAAVLERAQRNINEWGRLFTDAIAKGRQKTPAYVLRNFGRGDGMFALEAEKVGLIDAIDNFESVFARLSSTDAGAYPRGVIMPQPEDVRASDADNEWKCEGCKEMMGPSAKKYCAKCAAPDSDGDDDGDEDEEEAKALGLNPKATRAERIGRAAQLSGFEREVCTATSSATWSAALAKVIDGAKALAAGDQLRAEVLRIEGEGRRTALQALLERGLAGAPGEPARLSLGRIQREMSTVLRGETKKQWRAVMEKLSAEAEEAAKAKDEAKAKITARQVIDAACSVKLSAEDLEALSDFAASSAPVAAGNHVEPARNGEQESAELDAVSAEVTKLANQARAVLDRNSQPAAK
jgi:ClpP class serine protease